MNLSTLYDLYDEDIWNNITLFLNHSLIYNHSVGVRRMEDEEGISSHRQSVVTIGSVISVWIMVSNLILIVTIIADRSRHRQVFSLLIVNLCLADLIVGAVIMPLGVSYAHKDSWLHGENACVFWSVIHFLHYTITALALMAISINRVIAKVSPRTLVSTRGRCGSIVIATLPWILGVLVGTPLILSGRDTNMKAVYNLPETVCFFILEAEVEHIAFGLTHIAPVALLLITAVIMLIFYSVSRHAMWQQLAEDDDTSMATTEVKSLRMSTAAACLANVVACVMWSPFVVQILIIMLCKPGMCYPHFRVYAALYMLSQCNSGVSPYIWLLCPEIRSAYKDLYLRLASACSSCRRLVTRDTEMVVNFSKSQGGMANAHLTQQ